MIGDWLLDMGGIAAIRASTTYTLRFTPKATATTQLHSTPYTLRFTLLAPATLPLASNLSPYRLIAHCLPEAVF